VFEIRDLAPYWQSSFNQRSGNINEVIRRNTIVVVGLTLSMSNVFALNEPFEYICNPLSREGWWEIFGKSDHNRHKYGRKDKGTGDKGCYEVSEGYLMILMPMPLMHIIIFQQGLHLPLGKSLLL